MADIEARFTPEAAKTKYEPHIETGRFTKSLLFELCDDLVRPNGRVFFRCLKSDGETDVERIRIEKQRSDSNSITIEFLGRNNLKDDIDQEETYDLSERWSITKYQLGGKLRTSLSFNPAIHVSMVREVGVVSSMDGEWIPDINLTVSGQQLASLAKVILDTEVIKP